MARMKASVMDKMRLTAAKYKKHRTRRIRAFRTPIPRDADVSLVKPSDASAASAPQPILSDRFLFLAHLELVNKIQHYFLCINPISRRF